MLADDGHGEIADILAAEFLRQRQSQEPGLVGAAAHFAQQVFPFLARQAAMLEVCARPFAAMIEEAIVVVLLLQRNDFLLDEGVDLGQQILDVLRNCEVHGRVSRNYFRQLSALRRGRCKRQRVCAATGALNDTARVDFKSGSAYPNRAFAGKGPKKQLSETDAQFDLQSTYCRAFRPSGREDR